MAKEVKSEYGLDIVNSLPRSKYDAVVLTVCHREFLGLDIPSLCAEKSVVYDVKGCLSEEIADAAL